MDDGAPEEHPGLSSPSDGEDVTPASATTTAYPPRAEVRRIGSVREEPYFASPVFACPACGYLTTVGLPECPRCFSALPQPRSWTRIVVRSLEWLAVIFLAGWLLAAPWWLSLAISVIPVVREIRRPIPPRHPAQFR